MKSQELTIKELEARIENLESIIEVNNANADRLLEIKEETIEDLYESLEGVELELAMANRMITSLCEEIEEMSQYVDDRQEDQEDLFDCKYIMN